MKCSQSLLGVARRLDDARTARFMRRQPKRIILIRHAESIGNVDSSVSAQIPDNKLHITEYGQQQAYVSHWPNAGNIVYYCLSSVLFCLL